MLSGSIRLSRLGRCAQSVDSVITRLMSEKLAHPEILSLAAGFTDNRVLPGELVSEAVAELKAQSDTGYLQYGMNRGLPRLRQEVVHLLQGYPGEEGLPLDSDAVIITNGSQQALYLLVQMLCDPGDRVLVEQPSYFVFLELLRGLGVEPVSIPVDGAGRIDGPGLQELLEQFRLAGELDTLKLTYVMGTYANPSSRCLGETEKRTLVETLARADLPIPVVEDMAYRELYFDRPHPARSLLAMEHLPDLPVLYTGTFTKPFATGMKVGFVASRDISLLDIMAKIKGHQDFGTAHFNQCVLERVLADARYAGHLAGIRPHYREKRDLLEAALREYGLERAGWSWEQPQGGLLLWARAPEGFDTRMGSPFHTECLRQEILYVPGDLCFASGKPWNYVRLSFGALESEWIPEAARRFCAAALQAAAP